jgi:hypothetical protein
MKSVRKISLYTIKRLTVGTALVLCVAGAFASLGDGRTKKVDKPKRSLLTTDITSSTNGVFTLRTTYSFRGNEVINFNPTKQYIQLNTNVAYRNGNNVLVVPMKKKVLLNNKVTFNPNSGSR